MDDDVKTSGGYVGFWIETPITRRIDDPVMILQSLALMKVWRMIRKGSPRCDDQKVIAGFIFFGF